MHRRKISEPVVEDEEWMTTYADAITLLVAFFVMLVNFLKT
jgi:chemotaxis protein MotB